MKGRGQKTVGWVRENAKETAAADRALKMWIGKGHIDRVICLALQRRCSEAYRRPLAHTLYMYVILHLTHALIYFLYGLHTCDLTLLHSFEDIIIIYVYPKFRQYEANITNWGQPLHYPWKIWRTSPNNPIILQCNNYIHYLACPHIFNWLYRGSNIAPFLEPSPLVIPEGL